MTTSKELRGAIRVLEDFVLARSGTEQEREAINIVLANTAKLGYKLRVLRIKNGDLETRLRDIEKLGN